MKLTDVAAEKAVLAGVFQYGAKAYYDVYDIINENTFTSESNAIIFRCLKNVLERDDQIRFDVPTIFSSANELGLQPFFMNKNEAEHLRAITTFPIDLDNVGKFAKKLAKLDLARSCYTEVDKIKDKLLEVTGNESVGEILSLIENVTEGFSNQLSGVDSEPEKILADIDEYLQYLEDNPVSQVGISTGYKKYDWSIGGGLRPGTVNVIGARIKVGKTQLADNIGYHVAGNIELPVLSLDTEMTEEDHRNRIIAMLSQVSIRDIETGDFSKDHHKKKKVYDAAKQLKTIPYFYKSIAGITDFVEQQAIIRRWLMKEVGLKDDGTAKDCLILYDYIKLMTSDSIAKMQEYQALGFLMTSLHNLAVKYKIPILAFTQLNRDGVTKESTDVVSGSDRIMWLCSNFSIFKDKSDEEIEKDGPEAGNKKMVPLVARHGEGLKSGDYINFNMKGWCAKIEEGKTRFEIQNGKSDTTDAGFIIENDDSEEELSL